MRVEFTPSGSVVSFELHDVDPVLHDVLRQCFWQQTGEVWHRPYPADAPHLDRAMLRLSTHAEEMFRQLAYLQPVPWHDALLAFASRAATAGIDWWLTGSVSACVRGLPFEPHDVDVMVDHADVPALADAFADVLVEPIVDTGGWLTRDFGVLFWHARIDLASDPAASLDDPEPVDCGPYARAHLETVSYYGYDLRVPPLELLLAANRRRGRAERVDALAAHLAGPRRG